MAKVKRLYITFSVVFLMLFLVSSAFAHPMSWWSLHKVTGYFNSGFTTSYSGLKILKYVALSLVIAILINTSFVKNIVRSTLNN